MKIKNSALERELVKHGKDNKNVDLYQVILSYYTLRTTHDVDVYTHEKQYLDNYLTTIEEFSTFDVILYMAYCNFTVNMPQGFGHYANYLMVKGWIRKQLQYEDAASLRIAIGVWFDIVFIQYFNDDLFAAKEKLSQLNKCLHKYAHGSFDEYVASCIEQFMQNFSKPQLQRENIVLVTKILQSDGLLLSSFENDYWHQMLMICSNERVNITD